MVTRTGIGLRFLHRCNLSVKRVFANLLSPSFCGKALLPTQKKWLGGIFYSPNHFVIDGCLKSTPIPKTCTMGLTSHRVANLIGQQLRFPSKFQKFFQSQLTFLRPTGNQVIKKTQPRICPSQNYPAIKPALRSKALGSGSWPRKRLYNSMGCSEPPAANNARNA